MISRTKIIKCARSWIGTPYHHQASLKGVGCDCLGLVRGVYKELYGIDVKPNRPYSADWAEASGEESMLAAARSHLIEIPIERRQPGDILIFRFKNWAIAKHAAILVTETKMVHAIERAKTSEVSLGLWSQRHIAAAFSFAAEKKPLPAKTSISPNHTKHKS